MFQSFACNASPSPDLSRLFQLNTSCHSWRFIWLLFGRCLGNHRNNRLPCHTYFTLFYEVHENGSFYPHFSMVFCLERPHPYRGWSRDTVMKMIRVAFAIAFDNIRCLILMFPCPHLLKANEGRGASHYSKRGD